MAIFTPAATPPIAALVESCLMLRISSAVKITSLAASKSLLLTLVCTVLPIVLTVTPAPAPTAAPAKLPIEASTSKLFCAIPLMLSPVEDIATSLIFVTTLLLRLLIEVAPATPAKPPAPVEYITGFATAVLVAAIFTLPAAVMVSSALLSPLTSA